MDSSPTVGEATIITLLICIFAEKPTNQLGLDYMTCYETNGLFIYKMSIIVTDITCPFSIYLCNNCLFVLKISLQLLLSSHVLCFFKHLSPWRPWFRFLQGRRIGRPRDADTERVAWNAILAPAKGGGISPWVWGNQFGWTYGGFQK